MAFLNAEQLIELAIRAGVADLAEAPDEVTQLFGIPFGLNEGADLSPPSTPGSGPVQPTLKDLFQARINSMPKSLDEQANPPLPVFKNSPQQVPDLNGYLARGPNVAFVHGFPRTEQDLPAVCITLAGEEPSVEYLGGLKYEAVTAPGSGKIALRLGIDNGCQFHIHVLTPNYDETVLLYHLIRYGLLKYRPHLEAYGIREQRMNWQDCEPAAEYLQAGLFIYQRTCVFSCVKDESFLISDDGFTELAYQTLGGGVSLPGQVIP